MELFRGEQTSEEWRAYVEYIDDMVIDGFFNSIECSLRFFLDNTGRMLMNRRQIESQRETLALKGKLQSALFHYKVGYKQMLNLSPFCLHPQPPALICVSCHLADFCQLWGCCSIYRLYFCICVPSSTDTNSIEVGSRERSVPHFSERRERTVSPTSDPTVTRQYWSNELRFSCFQKHILQYCWALIENVCEKEGAAILAFSCVVRSEAENTQIKLLN